MKIPEIVEFLKENYNVQISKSTVVTEKIWTVTKKIWTVSKKSGLFYI